MAILLSERKKESTGKSDHEYASQFGWTFDLELSSSEYLTACEHFESSDELEAIAQKSVQRAIKFRSSLLGRILTFVRTQSGRLWYRWD